MAVGFFDRISAGFELAQSSWQVLRQSKQLIVFPILSGLACLLVLASFALPFLVHPQWLNFLDAPAGQGMQVPVWSYLILFAYYFCTYFVIVFFNAALVSCALMSFNGEEPTVSDGLQAAGSRLPQILAWALVSATAGVLLKVLESAHERVGQIVSAILGTAWTIMTFFVVPVLVVEKVGPFEAVGRSMSILRKTWGEGLVGSMGIRLFLFLLAIPGILLAVFGFMALGQAPALGVLLLALAGLYYLALLAVGSALDGIFLTALYQYAAFDRVPGAFDRGVLARAFERKR
ncbi:MAG TPA: DUF6159 family protein [Gemmataceae bacterium]|jgi:hypothetical protein|nr:DUF6159 family protein [Gemmataceae bacterium]